MVCGVHLGILLAVFCQAEYVHCLWAMQAQSSQRQSSSGYVGLSQQDSGLKRLGASDPQNGLRQASVSPGLTQKSSINGPAQSSSGFSRTRLVQSASSSARLLQTNSVSKPKQVRPQKFFGLSTAIASGNSVSKYNKEPTVPVQQNTRKYPSSSSASLYAPSGRSSSTFPSSYSVAKASASYEQGDSSLSQRSSSLLSPKATSSQRHSVQVQTSATAPARRVSIRRTSKVPRPATFLPSKTTGEQSVQSYSSQGSSWNGSPAQGPLYQPAPGRDGTRYAPSRVYSIPQQFGGFNIRRLSEPVEQKKISATKPLESYTASSGPIVLHKPQAQSYTAPSAQADSYKPQVQNVRKPQQTQVAPSVQTLSYKPQQTDTTSSAQAAIYKPQVQSERKPQQVQAASSVHIVSYKPQGMSAQSVLFKPQAQSIMKPQQTAIAPSAQTVSYKPRVQSVDEPVQTHTDSSAINVPSKFQVQTVGKLQKTVPVFSYNQQKTYMDSPAQAVSYKPQVQSERKPQQVQAASSVQIVSYKPQGMSAQSVLFKPQQTNIAPAAQAVSYKPQVQTFRAPAQTHTASSVQTLSYKPQQTVIAPSAQAVSYKLQVYGERKQNSQMSPSAGREAFKSQQTFSAPSAQTVSSKPQVQSVQQAARWKRINSNQQVRL